MNKLVKIGSVGAFAVLAAILLTVATRGSTFQTSQSAEVKSESQRFNLAANGDALAGPIGENNLDFYLLAQGSIVLSAADMDSEMSAMSGMAAGGDSLTIDALISAGGKDYLLKVDRVMAQDPRGKLDTWNGVAFDRDMAAAISGSPDNWGMMAMESSGNQDIKTSGSAEDREIKVGFVGFGYGTLTCHDDVLGQAMPVRVMTISSPGFPWDAKLVLDIGFLDLGPIPGLPAGQKDLRVLWQGYTDEIPEGIQLSQAAEVCK